jgi:predicted benzoate:H+ symporter BenE
MFPPFPKDILCWKDSRRLIVDSVSTLTRSWLVAATINSERSKVLALYAHHSKGANNFILTRSWLVAATVNSEIKVLTLCAPHSKAANNLYWPCPIHITLCASSSSRLKAGTLLSPNGKQGCNG